MSILSLFCLEESQFSVQNRPTSHPKLVHHPPPPLDLLAHQLALSQTMPPVFLAPCRDSEVMRANSAWRVLSLHLMDVPHRTPADLQLNPGGTQKTVPGVDHEHCIPERRLEAGHQPQSVQATPPRQYALPCLSGLLRAPLHLQLPK